MNKPLIVVRGAGDIATGVLYILKNFGYDVIATEISSPSSIRRTVSLSEAVYDGTYTVENVTAERSEASGVTAVLSKGYIPVLVDPKANIIRAMKPDIVVDAVLAKRNTGVSMNMAKTVIGVGPGFTAGEDVHAVVETSRGHELGRVVLEGSAHPDSGIPGVIGGYTKERVIYTPYAGKIKNIKKIGDHVEAGDVIATVDGQDILASINGTLRGLIRDGYTLTKGFKTADVDPRDVRAHCFTVSDKARLVGYGVLMAIQMLAGGK